MTNKFNVGDKVEVLNVEEICLGHEIKIANGYATVESVGPFGRPYLTCKTGLPLIIGKKELPFIRKVDENETLENQRISKLEEEVAELKLIVEQIRKPSPLVSAASIIALGADEPKTANQLRAEIIEKAKQFIQYFKKKTHTFKAKQLNGTKVTVENVYLVPSYKNLSKTNMRAVCNLEFVVNADKGVVVALLKGYHTKRLMSKGIAKCNPSDVFNEHIGKAIALGRALRLDVSEFERAVRPDEVALGMVVVGEFGDKGGVALKSDSENFSLGYVEDEASTFKIINDTNAQYEVTK